MSKQDYETPDAFIDAVRERFGPIVHDLAASETNTKAQAWYSKEQDALTEDWSSLPPGLRWLNPPFALIGPWACAAAVYARPDKPIAMLTPASIGSHWFATYVHGRALVLGLSPRLTFVGCTACYPKDLMLSVFGVPAGFDVWRWT